jgi:hypothetical protein
MDKKLVLEHKSGDDYEEIMAEFRLEDLLGIGFTIIVLGIGLAYGLNVMGDVRDDMTVDTAEYNASKDAIAAVAKIPAKLGLIVTVVIASVIIGILVTYLWVRFK